MNRLDVDHRARLPGVAERGQRQQQQQQDTVDRSFSDCSNYVKEVMATDFSTPPLQVFAEWLKHHTKEICEVLLSLMSNVLCICSFFFDFFCVSEHVP